MTKPASNLYLFFAVTLIAAIILVVACSDMSPVTPIYSDHDGGEPGLPQSDNGDPAVDTTEVPDAMKLDDKAIADELDIVDPIDSTHLETADTAIVDPGIGGRVELDSLDGNNYLDIASDALNSTTEITVSMYRYEAAKEEKSDRLEFVFGPPGLELSLIHI